MKMNICLCLLNTNMKYLPCLFVTLHFIFRRICEPLSYQFQNHKHNWLLIWILLFILCILLLEYFKHLHGWCHFRRKFICSELEEISNIYFIIIYIHTIVRYLYSVTFHSQRSPNHRILLVMNERQLRLTHMLRNLATHNKTLLPVYTYQYSMSAISKDRQFYYSNVFMQI